ncbi:carbon-nitrogen hydrolase family protein [Anaerostipes faecalis]|uniref:carbon-nitrogen hydrolase family protein n=1 Tax=Anaerostipes faecalis TaxID=2738446 RepID=UPI001C1E76CB|nr:carbon-nitrogen hydrolase family protein [Anaerostipes faecalis]
MAVKLALAQTTSSLKWEENVMKAERYIKEAKRQGVKLILFPEYFMMYYPSEEINYRNEAQSLDGPFVSRMKELAKQYEMWIIAGMNEDSLDKEKSYNTIVLIDDSGRLAARYHKNHLFNAFSCQESEDTLEGQNMFIPVDSPAGVIGMGCCYDLRFPEVARLAALGGAQVMFYPSAWVKGNMKYEQWESLLRARAIENEMYVFGCCHYSPMHYMGRSIGFDPMGEKIIEGEEKEQLLVCEIDLGKIQKVRRDNPVFENRRTDLYSLLYKK